MTPEEYRNLPTAKRSKYCNKKVVVDGIRFDSQKEAKRYGILKMRERAREIEYLVLQPVYELKVGVMLICKYKADFAYTEKGSIVVEDVKGMKTPAYKLKAKLFEAIYGFKILET